PQRATLVAEGDAAIHAARALRLEAVLGRLEIELAPVLEPLGNRTPRRRLAPDLHEAGNLAHLTQFRATRSDRRQARHVIVGAEMLPLQYRAIFRREHLDEFPGERIPVLKDPLGHAAAGVLPMTPDERLQLLQVVGVAYRAQFDHAHVTARGER